MKLKQIEEHYGITYKTKDGKYCIFDKNVPGKRVGYKYRGTIVKRIKKFVLEGYPPVKTIEEFEKQLLDYEASLEWDVEYYCPMYREGIFEEYIIHDGLTALGYKQDGGHDDYFFYKFSQEEVGTIYISVSYKKEILRHHFEAFSWTDFKNLQSLKEYIEIAKELLLDLVNKNIQANQKLLDKLI